MDSLLLWLQPLFSSVSASAFTLWGSPVTWLEIVALLLSLAMVVFNIRVNPLGWPLAIAASLLYFLLFWQSRLYGEASLQIFFVGVALWGWWQWLRGTQEGGAALRVRALGAWGRVGVLVAIALAWPATALLLRHTTDSDVPWWDAFPTAASVVGQWLLGRKYVENWPTWLVVNVVSVALFAYKGLWLTALLYALFVAMSMIGWRAWARMAAR
jgi:nicotinamide mononucleotide transporter